MKFLFFIKIISIFLNKSKLKISFIIFINIKIILVFCKLFSKKNNYLI